MLNFINYSKRKNLSKSTISTYTSSLRLMQVDQDNWLQTKKRLLNKDFSASTVHLHKNVLINFYKFKGDKSKLRKLSILKLPTIEVKYYVTLTKNLIYKKTTISEKDSKLVQKWKIIIKFLFETGIRATELNNLSLIGDRLYVLGKGNKKRQIFYIKETLHQLLKDNSDLKKFDSAKTLRIYVKRILGKRITPHTLRRSFATHMLNSGCNPKSVMLQMGHSKIETTYRYLNLSEKYNKQNYDKFMKK